MLMNANPTPDHEHVNFNMYRVYQTGAGDSCLTVRSNFGTNGAPIKYAVLSALNPGAAPAAECPP